MILSGKISLNESKEYVNYNWGNYQSTINE